MSMTKTVQKWALASVELRDAYTDFMLSRQAMNCAPTTLDFYNYTAGKFLAWIEQRSVTARYVREYIAELVSNGRKDTTVWDHTRTIKTMLHFWHAKDTLPERCGIHLQNVPKTTPPGRCRTPKAGTAPLWRCATRHAARLPTMG